VRIVPVIDLKANQVVRGVAGRRHEYRPVQSVLTASAAPGEVAAALLDVVGGSELYLADLESIAGEAVNLPAMREVAAAGARLWLDAGLQTADQAERLFDLGLKQGFLGQLVVALESIESIAELERISRNLPQDRLRLSVDLMNGRPLTKIAAWESAAPLEIAAAAVELGIDRFIVLDLADVGVGRGIQTLELCRQLQQTYPSAEIAAGGGVRSLADLRTLADAGCEAALVASALHSGAIGREELAALA